MDYTKNEINKPNYWLYSTISLVVLGIILAVGLLAFMAGQNSQEQRVIANNSQSNSVANNADNGKRVSNITPANNSSDNKTATNSMSMVSTVQPNSSMRTINGEIFVVTNGRENVKMALVQVCALSETSITNWIKNKKDAAVARMRDSNQKIQNLIEEKNRISSEKGSALNRNELWKIEDRERDASYQLSLADIQHYFWISPEYYLQGLSTCEYEAKTDSDGRFRLDIPSGKRYALAAQTSRRIIDKTETYWWLVWSSPQDSQSVILSNDNLMAKNPSNRVISIDPYIPRY